MKDHPVVPCVFPLHAGGVAEGPEPTSRTRPEKLRTLVREPRKSGSRTQAVRFANPSSRVREPRFTGVLARVQLIKAYYDVISCTRTSEPANPGSQTRLLGFGNPTARVREPDCSGSRT